MAEEHRRDFSELIERLHSMEIKQERSVQGMESSMANVNLQLGRIISDIEDLREVLHGNGNPGLKTDVDRLKEAEKARRWHLRTVWVAIVGVIVSTILSNIHILK